MYHQMLHRITGINILETHVKVVFHALALFDPCAWSGCSCIDSHSCMASASPMRCLCYCIQLEVCIGRDPAPQQQASHVHRHAST